jgi:DNA-binding transcriptional ArsR family regulator
MLPGNRSPAVLEFFKTLADARRLRMLGILAKGERLKPSSGGRALWVVRHKAVATRGPGRVF